MTEANELTPDETRNVVEEAPIPMEEATDSAYQLYQDIIDAFEVEATVYVTSVEEYDIHLDAQGNESDGGILIGRHGQTLEAIQTLISTIVAREASPRIRVFLDAFGYRARRADSLRQMALGVAEQVRQTGQEALTEPLNAMERWIIHTALQEEEGINTYSEGSEPNRYVVISPAD